MSKYKSGLDAGVNNVGYTIVRLAPIIAPVPALATLLDATNYVLYAWFVVIGVELTGYAIGEQLVRSIRLKVLSLRLASIPLIIYGLVIEGLMLGYKVMPAWANWYAGQVDTSAAIQAGVGVLYPFFTLAGAVLFAFHEYLESVGSDEQYEKASARQQSEQSATDDREFDRQKRQAELDAYRTKLAQDAEIEREQALAELRIKEKKAVAKLESKPAKSDSGSDSKGDSENRVNVDYERVVINYFRDNPLASQRKAASDTGISQPKISKTLSNLESIGRIHRNGNGIEILED